MSALRDLAIELWVEKRDGRPAVNPVIAALLELLARDGAATAVRTPETELLDPRRPPADVILLKNANPIAVAAALAAERRGALVVNSAAATARANDKAAAVAALAAVGVAVPETLLADRSCTDAAGLAGAWIAKPVRGVHGVGVHAGRSYRDALAGVAVNGSAVLDDGTRIVQRLVGRGAIDVKVYAAGDRLFAGGKRFDQASFRCDRIRPLEPTSEMREVALAAGAALGLTLFGVDLRREREELYVVDVNPFPGYRGFPAAAAALRDEIARRVAA